MISWISSFGARPYTKFNAQPDTGSLSVNSAGNRLTNIRPDTGHPVVRILAPFVGRFAF